MRGFTTGFIAGAAVLYGSMCFHVVLADDGYHFVQKTALTFKDTYADIRRYDVAEWRNHVPLAEAMLKAEKHEVIRNSAQGAVQNAFENLWNRQVR
jgi:hypothetical protein